LYATRRDAWWLRHAALLAALVACATCTHGDITVVEPAAKGPNDTLAITILPGEAAAALGWTSGIPGAEVILAPSVKPRAWGGGDTATGPAIDTLLTDSTGRVSVPDLPPGWYYVEVHRWLSDAERAKLAPGEDLIGFATQKTVERGRDTVYAASSHRRSIVISEVSNIPQWLGGNSLDSYTLGGYLELTNNSDTTVYLDGLVIGLMSANSDDFAGGGFCAAHATWDDDPDGVWVEYMDTLPGTGHDYPLAPGAQAVIATIGMDHRALSPVWGLDLSHADFECIGIADADNPGVPNCVAVPIRSNGTWAGAHGMIFSYNLGSAVVVALPVDTASVPIAQKWAGSEKGWVLRIPRDHVLDMLFAYWATLDNPCPRQVNSAFDLQAAPLWTLYLPDGTWHGVGAYSIQRRVAYTRSDGRKLLQDTRSTEADFYIALRTPFALPSGPP
jgi:hypothetical protein